MEIIVSARAAVPLAIAWPWWIDFGEAGEQFPMTHGFGPMQRRILSRSGDEWVMEERWPLGLGVQSRRKVTVHRAEHAIDEVFLKPAGLASRWWFEADGEGVRISRSLRVARRHEKISRWVSQRDLEHHVRAMERALGHPK